MRWLAEYIQAWARHGIYFGVVCRAGDMDGCAGTFRAACLKGTMPPRLPANLAVATSLHDDCLVYRFPHSDPNRERKGRCNEHFLNPENLLNVLRAIPDKVIVILSLAQIYGTEGVSFNSFLETLESFLSRLPLPKRYALEIQNPEFLLPDYYDCLRRYDIAHVMNGDLERIALTGDFGLLRVPTLESVEIRLGVVEAVRRAVEERKALMVYMPDVSSEYQNLSGVMELLNTDLAKLSRFKKQRAA